MTEAQADDLIYLGKKFYVLCEAIFGMLLAIGFWRFAWIVVIGPVLDLLHRRGILRTR